MKLIWLMVVVLAMLALSGPALDALRELSEEVRVPERARSGKSLADESQTGAMYRWRDAGGTLHIESSPPPDDVPFEIISFTRSVTPESRDEQTAGKHTGGEAQRSPLSVYTPDGMQELMQSVDETARQLEQRDQLLKTLEGDL